MEKEEFYELLCRVVTSDEVLICGDFDVHVGKEVGHGVGQFNDRGV